MNKNYSNSSVCYFAVLKLHAATHKFEAKPHVKTNYLKKTMGLFVLRPTSSYSARNFANLQFLAH